MNTALGRAAKSDQSPQSRPKADHIHYALSLDGLTGEVPIPPWPTLKSPSSCARKTAITRATTKILRFLQEDPRFPSLLYPRKTARPG